LFWFNFRAIVYRFVWYSEMHGIHEQLLRGKHTQTTVYRSCVHTFRKSYHGTTSSEILANSSLKPLSSGLLGAKISKRIL